MIETKEKLLNVFWESQETKKNFTWKKIFDEWKSRVTGETKHKL